VRKSYLTGMLMVCALLLSGCGGGGSSSSTSSGGSSTGTSTATNSVPVIVDSGPAAVIAANEPAINEPFVSVTICAPANPSNCQTIDHILVDTGSSGLRILSSALSPSITLPQQTDAGGNAITECTTFADGYSWGTIKTANMQIGNEAANGLAIQIIGDPNYSSIPDSCSGTGQTSENTVVAFGSNGVIGVGLFAQDCGSSCAQSTYYPTYYSCTSSTSCQPITMSLAQQVQNPVSLFKTDNNGVILSLPAISSSGAVNVSGTLTFGIGTESNNGLGSAVVYTTDPDFGYVTTTYNGVSYADSFLDSGSNGLYFTDNSIPICGSNSDFAGFYCPTSTLNLSATIAGQNGASDIVNFSVGNPNNISSSVTAYGLLAGGNADASGFDWGLPFFYGRNVYTAIEGSTTPGGAGPYFAF
jgi:hypothetical protein